MERSSEAGFSGIVVRGAREHNLKNVTVEIPRNKMTVVTGLSGSGKSSLAFDIIYAEGQRRYVESLSAYARNFLEQLKKPDVESISGLSPSIAIDQKSVGSNPRSTVGTVTEIYDFMRLLFSRVGVPNCPTHRVPVASFTPQQIVAEVMRLPTGSRVTVMAPVVQGKKGEFLAEFQKWSRKGLVRARVDGEWIELESAKRLAKHKRHDIDLLIDKLTVDEKFRSRLSESIHLAVGLTDGLVTVDVQGKGEKIYSLHAACPECGFSFPDLDPRLFSFNNPRGACPTCNGLGTLDLSDSPTGEEGDEESDGEEGVDEYALSSCPDCQGRRLSPEALNVLVGGKNIAELADMPASDLLRHVESMRLDDRQKLIGEKINAQIAGRLRYMERVGTGYLSISRPTRTLSGGETQRIRLATQVGSALIGVLYVLDEPSIGLHPRDHHRLLDILREMRDRGNTILLVEHDEDTIRSADHVLDLGPRAGSLGGHVIASGTPDEIAAHPESVTGLYLSGRRRVPVPETRRKGNGQSLVLKGATGNNLRDVDLEIPLGTLCGVSGVSGSGKSTLIVDTLYRSLAQHFFRALKEPAPYREIVGLEHLDKVIDINQRPIGRTPRSTPATYTGLFPLIRNLFAEMPHAKMRGFKPGHFSFNVKGGRCEVCGGGGQVRVEMHFLSDVFVPCDVCRGRRYNSEVLSVKFRDKSIADVLEMSVEEAREFFKNHAPIHRKLETLHRVGLDYITLGQSSTTLSGGEAQRVKLSKELSKRGTGKTLYILDEPTTGLHFEDVAKLIELLQDLVAQGNTVLVIEHNLDVLKSCDHLIDLGPDGGAAGGLIVAQGTPEKVVQARASETGRFLKTVLTVSH